MHVTQERKNLIMALRMTAKQIEGGHGETIQKTVDRAMEMVMAHSETLTSKKLWNEVLPNRMNQLAPMLVFAANHGLVFDHRTAVSLAGACRDKDEFDKMKALVYRLFVSHLNVHATTGFENYEFGDAIHEVRVSTGDRGYMTLIVSSGDRGMGNHGLPGILQRIEKGQEPNLDRGYLAHVAEADSAMFGLKDSPAKTMRDNFATLSTAERSLVDRDFELADSCDDLLQGISPEFHRTAAYAPVWSKDHGGEPGLSVWAVKAKDGKPSVFRAGDGHHLVLACIHKDGKAAATWTAVIDDDELGNVLDGLEGCRDEESVSDLFRVFDGAKQSVCREDALRRAGMEHRRNAGKTLRAHTLVRTISGNDPVPIRSDKGFLVTVKESEDNLSVMESDGVLRPLWEVCPADKLDKSIADLFDPLVATQGQRFFVEGTRLRFL